MDATLSDPLVGRSLEGRYAIEAFIAHGGMASVYVATDTRLERRVAVKVMHAHLSDDQETVARFEREARSAARLSHPDVVAVYDQGVDHGRPFLVMEFVPGANLRHIIRDRGRLTAAEAVAVMDHVLAALAAAHAAGLVHRDVKPENVLVTTDGRVKVADFGLARAVAGSTVTTTGSVLMGTAAYLAPEQFEHGTADERSDVYSAGVLFFELLTGSTPYTADSAYALLSRHASEDIPSPSTRASGIAPQIDALVTWAASRDPQERPEDAGEFHAELIDVRNRLNLHGSVPTPPIELTTRVPTADRTAVIGAQPVDEVTRAVGGVVPPPPTGPVSRVQPDAPRPPVHRRIGVIVAVAVLIVVIVAAVLGWWLAAGRYTNAPKVLGFTKAQAIAKLHGDGYHVRFGAPVYSTAYKTGLVAAESGASHVKHGATITLQLSQGGRPHQLSDYQGYSVDDVTADLAALNIDVGKVKNVYSDVKKGLVVATVPGAGQTVREGSKVTLEVSRGQQHVRVPDVTGKTQDEATQILSDKGFTVTPVQHYSSSVDSGNVIRTRPGAGHKPVKGTTITLIVSQGPRLYDVPDVTGEDITQAVKDIRNAGFNPNPVQTLPGGPGQVLQESPTGQQPHGTTIELDYF
ncbi:MAG: Stk1 family PASTA domain-containing Ser/Thr kinase [Frankiaceae bacterium]|nr:Stk1 family PASTA domain-containing Ser/Thr kinase [Frankiaceae bacterium]MBV9872683.1 Stk1 family PASTA domain-containing Ser/Thr kinase [Frankiaceae bacterium]